MRLSFTLACNYILVYMDRQRDVNSTREARSTVNIFEARHIARMPFSFDITLKM